MSFSLFTAANAQPRAEALILGAARLEYAELAQRVAARVHELAEQGMNAPGAPPVGLLCDASAACFEQLYAALALGVPILPLHPRLTEPEQARLLAQAGARLVLSSTQATPFAGPLPELPAPPPGAPLAYVPSSGSAGTPKLVRLSRAAFHASAQADSENIGSLASDRALLCLPLSHVGGLSIVTRSLLARRPIVVFTPGAGGLLSALSALAETITRERISLLSLVPAVLERLLRSEPSWRPPASLRAVLLGGAACSPELYALARERGVPVLPSYGLTESASQIVTARYAERAPAGVRGGIVSSGFPLRGVELRVQSGQLQARGPMLCDGYLGERSPFTPDGWLETGDRAELDPELGLFVLGRASELIITGGENVDPVEVEHALASFPGVRAACVFGVEDATFGQRVAAVLEVDEDATWSDAELLAHLSARVAPFKRPRLSARVASLPRLASGKLDRRAARARGVTALLPFPRPQ